MKVNWKGRFKFVKSLRFRILVILIIIGIVPSIIVEKGIVNSYEDRAVSNRQLNVKNQCDILVNQLAKENYLEDPSSEGINSELTMLTNVYSGRILIVNQDFQVIKDTYDLDKGKYMISKEVVKCFQKMKESSHYDRKNSYIEMTMPIPGTDGETTQGVLLISISTEEIVSSIDILEQKGLTILVIIGALVLDLAGVVVTFLDAHCPVGLHAPQPHAARVVGAVVDRDKKAAIHPGGRPAQQVGIRAGRHKGVNQTFGHHPAPADVPLIKHAGVLCPVPRLDRLGQAQVVIHRKVQVQQVLGAGLQNPAFVEPVLRPLRVAVEPELGTVHRTAGGGLVYKAFRHQGNFVKQRTCQRNALDQVLAALVLAAEQVVIVGHGPAGHDQQIVAPALGGSVAAGGQHLLEHPHHVAPQAGNGFAAQGKVLAVKARHTPQHKTEGE